jgi:hypothetical protein
MPLLPLPLPLPGIYWMFVECHDRRSKPDDHVMLAFAMPSLGG